MPSEFRLRAAISGEYSTHRSHQPTGLILDPLNGKLVDGPGDMDGLALHAGFVSFAGHRLGIHDHKAGQGAKVCTVSHSGVGDPGT